MKRVLSTLCLTCLFGTVLAQEANESQDDWYEVEVIIFEHLAAETVMEEHWPQEPGQPDKAGAIELGAESEIFGAGELLPTPAPGVADPAMAKLDAAKASPSTKLHQLLPYEQYRLQSEYTKLLKSENYLPLLHVAWRQPVPDRKNPDRVYIHSDLRAPVIRDNEVIGGIQEAVTSDVLALPPAPDMKAILPSEGGNAEGNFQPRTIEGVLSISRARYLHVDADILLHKPVELAELIEDLTPPPPAPLEEESAAVVTETADTESQELIEEALLPSPNTRVMPKFFRVKDSMRMRSGELHYLDHPMVGMLILFTPYTPPEPEVEAPGVNTMDEPLIPKAGTTQP